MKINTPTTIWATNSRNNNTAYCKEINRVNNLVSIDFVSDTQRTNSCIWHAFISVAESSSYHLRKYYITLVDNRFLFCVAFCAFSSLFWICNYAHCDRSFFFGGWNFFCIAKANTNYIIVIVIIPSYAFIYPFIWKVRIFEANKNYIFELLCMRAQHCLTQYDIVIRITQTLDEKKSDQNGRSIQLQIWDNIKHIAHTYRWYHAFWFVDGATTSEECY